MSPALDERTAPDTASGAVPFRPGDAACPTAPPPLLERDFWRAVAVTTLATLRPWLR